MVVLACCCPIAALWIPAYAGMTVGFAKVSIKGEGEMRLACLVVAPPCGYCLKASMTGRGGWFVLL